MFFSVHIYESSKVLVLQSYTYCCDELMRVHYWPYLVIFIFLTKLHWRLALFSILRVNCMIICKFPWFILQFSNTNILIYMKSNHYLTTAHTVLKISLAYNNYNVFIIRNISLLYFYTLWCMLLFRTRRYGNLWNGIKFPLCI